MVDYQVEAILDRRGHRESAEYLIKWMNFSKKDATWEPISNLSNIRNMIKKFNKRRRSEQKQIQKEIEMKAIKHSRFLNPVLKLQHPKDYKEAEVPKKVKTTEKFSSPPNELVCSSSSNGNNSPKQNYKANSNISGPIFFPRNISKPNETTCASSTKSNVQAPLIYQPKQPEVKKTPSLCLQLEKSKSAHLFVSQSRKKTDIQISNPDPESKKLESIKVELENAIKILDHFETKHEFLVKVLVADKEKDQEKVVIMHFSAIEKAKPELLAAYCKKLIHTLKI